MITKEFAEHFAKEWIESWNTHDLKKVFRATPTILLMSSPFITKITNDISRFQISTTQVSRGTLKVKLQNSAA